VDWAGKWDWASASIISYAQTNLAVENALPAGLRDVPSADIPSPLAQLRSQISSLFLSRHWKKCLNHYKGRYLNGTVMGKFVANFGMLKSKRLSWYVALS